MSNIDLFGNNLLNIINGDCVENNPLEYFLKVQKKYNIMNIFDIYNLKLNTKYCISIWDNCENIIYTFSKNTNTNKIEIFGIDKDKNKIVKNYIVNDNTEETNNFNYYMYIVNDILYYTSLDNNDKLIELMMINLNTDEVENIINLNDVIYTLDLEFCKSENILYTKSYKNSKFFILSYDNETKELHNYLMEEKLNEFFTFTVYKGIIYLIDNDGILSKHKINSDKTTTFLSEKILDNKKIKKKIIVDENTIYISNVICNNYFYLIAYDKYTLNIKWRYKHNFIIDDFKIIYNDLFLNDFNQFIKLKKQTGKFVTFLDLKNISGFQLHRDTNIYYLQQNCVNALIPKINN